MYSDVYIILFILRNSFSFELFRLLGNSPYPETNSVLLMLIFNLNLVHLSTRATQFPTSRVSFKEML